MKKDAVKLTKNTSNTKQSHKTNIKGQMYKYFNQEKKGRTNKNSKTNREKQGDREHENNNKLPHQDWARFHS